MLRHVRQRQAALGVEQLPHDEIADLAASFQRRVVDTLLERDVRRGALARRAGRSASPAACRPTRACAPTRCAKAERSEIPVFIPRLSLSTDNAAMIAAAGLRQLAAGRFAAADLNAAASLAL